MSTLIPYLHPPLRRLFRLWQIGDLLTGQRLPSVTQRAWSGSEARRLRVTSRACVREVAGHVAVVVRAVRRVVLRCRVLGIRALGCASDGVRHAARDGRADARGRATRDRS